MNIIKEISILIRKVKKLQTSSESQLPASKVNVAAGTNGVTATDLQASIQSLANRIKALESA